MPSVRLTETSLERECVPPTDAAQAYYWDTERKGFGVVVGKTGVKTFVMYGWVAGKNKKSKVKIGVAGSVRPDRNTWTVKLARKEADEIVAEFGRGFDRNAEKRADAIARSEALTLRAALALYVAELRDNHKSERSIETVEYDVPRLLSAWLDKPLADLTVEVVQAIKEKGRAHKTTTNRLLAELQAIWNVALRLRRSSFTAANPVGKLGVQKYKLEGRDAPKRERVLDEDMPEWFRRVGLLQGLRRDLQLTTLFTGMRDSNVIGMRWEHVNVTSRAMQVSIPGEKKPMTVPAGALLAPRSKTTPFVIPLSPTVIDILKRRRDENKVLFLKSGDNGFVFPAWTREKPRSVIATPETKERRSDKQAAPWGEHANAKYKATGKRVLFLPGLHALRRTYTSVASDAGVSDLHQRILTNHSIGGRDVHERYVISDFEALRESATRIDAALWQKLQPGEA
jgi:integrase